MEWEFELIFVDDDSTDKTTSTVNRYRLLDNRIKLLRLPKRLGKGGSIIAAALNYDLKEYMAYVDADLSADPFEFEQMLKYIQDNDVVLGSRILRGDLPPISRPLYRSLLSHLYSRLFVVLFRLPVRDPQCGFKLFRSEIVRALFDGITITGFAFDTELVVTAFSQGLRVKEVPIDWVHGKSSTFSILNETTSMGLDILSIWYHYHSLWRQGKVCYPQKRGSIYGRIFFGILSLTNAIKKRHLFYEKRRLEANTKQTHESGIPVSSSNLRQNKPLPPIVSDN